MNSAAVCLAPLALGCRTLPDPVREVGLRNPGLATTLPVVERPGNERSDPPLALCGEDLRGEGVLAIEFELVAEVGFGDDVRFSRRKTLISRVGIDSGSGLGFPLSVHVAFPIVALPLRTTQALLPRPSIVRLGGPGPVRDRRALGAREAIALPLPPGRQREFSRHSSETEDVNLDQLIRAWVNLLAAAGFSHTSIVALFKDGDPNTWASAWDADFGDS